MPYLGDDWYRLVRAVPDTDFAEYAQVGELLVRLDSLLSMGELRLLSAPWCTMSVNTQTTFVYFTSIADAILWQTITLVIVRSEAWLYCDGCVLVEYFLKWCVKTFVLLFSQDVSAKPWAYKCANRIPCFRKCSRFTFNPAILVCEGIALLQSVDVDLVITT